MTYGVGAPAAADVLVIFGITGDLARGDDVPLALPARAARAARCPIVGVAVDDWTVDELRERARESIVAPGRTLDEEVFARLAARLSYVPATSTTPRPTSGRGGHRRRGRSSTSRSRPSSSAASSRASPGPG